MTQQSREAAAYEKHKNLKIAADEIGIPWGVLYTRLRKQGVAVTGDKSRYGAPRDKFAAASEALFQRLVPSASNMNDTKFQAHCDFEIGGLKIDVKAATPRHQTKGSASLRWAFLLRKQTQTSDFICCLCFKEDGQTLEKMLLIPKEIYGGIQTVSFPCRGGGKWADYEMNPEELNDFFLGLSNKH